MNDPIHERQRARARVMALILAGFAVLFFAITIVKMKNGRSDTANMTAGARP